MPSKDSNMSPPRRLKKRYIALMAFVLLLVVGHFSLMSFVNKKVKGFHNLIFDETSQAESKAILKDKVATLNSVDEDTRPMREVEVFDDEAHNWSHYDSLYATGALLVDVNGDGRLDAYFCQDGENWVRDSDERGVLRDKPRLQRNVLYMNQGNDEEGNPKFIRADILAEANERFTEEELLVENYLVPRKSPADSTDRIGRKSTVAVAADFNNDGLMDILIGNSLPGIEGSSAETERSLPHFVNPIGRQSRKSKMASKPLGISFVHDYKAEDNTNDQRETSRGQEYVGANTLLLNRGDKDGDGLPEWEDASRIAGVEGRRNTRSLSIADVDLDGDLDIYEGNVPDMDYFPSGATKWAGAVNQMYINQLAETGELKFEERASEMKVDGLFGDDFHMPNYYKLRKLPFLPWQYSLMLPKMIEFKPDYLSINGEEGEHAEITWATTFQDVNEDGYPDIWVANDFGMLRLFINEGGKRFRNTEHARSNKLGFWMGLMPGDFNGDLREDIMGINFGGALITYNILRPEVTSYFDPTVNNACFLNLNKFNPFHALIDGRDFTRELDADVTHSRFLPPDASIESNQALRAKEKKQVNFKQNSLAPYEFGWGSAGFDIQNDGLLDFYFLGALYGRGGGVAAVRGTNPGRLMVNHSGSTDQLRFADGTAEHHVFNIQEMQYDKLAEGYVYRKAPLQNWQQRDMVYSYDRTTWVNQGEGVQNKTTNQSLIQTSELGRGAISADLNGDGFPDLLLRNVGGYDSRSSAGSNLRVRINGGVHVLTSHNYNYPSLTNYEPGKSRLFLNTYSKGHWLKIRLRNDDPGSFNRDGIGARIIVNNSWLRVKRSGSGSYVSNNFEDAHFGMGEHRAKEVVVHWPDKERTVTTYQLNDEINTTLVLTKSGQVLQLDKNRFAMKKKGGKTGP